MSLGRGDASLFSPASAPSPCTAAATPSAAPHASHARGACADSGHRLAAATPADLLPGSRPDNTLAHNRSRCRCRPAGRTPGSGTAGRSSPAPQLDSTTQWTNACGACITIRRRLPIHGTAPKVRGGIGKIVPRAFGPLSAPKHNGVERRRRRAPAARARADPIIGAQTPDRRTDRLLYHYRSDAASLTSLATSHRPSFR